VRVHVSRRNSPTQAHHEANRLRVTGDTYCGPANRKD
jgi:hypothetical protein